MPRLPDEPTMSDNTLLVSVEDLINRAMGPPDVNTVNFKLVQTILHILARQQRILEQRVEIRVTELQTPKSKTKREPSDTETSSSKSPKAHRPPRSPKPRMSSIKEVEVKKERDTPDREAQKERERALKEAQKERERADRAALKEKERAERSDMKDKERAERAALREKEKLEKSAMKEHEKTEKSALKEKEKAERAAIREKEKFEKSAVKEQEKSERSAMKEKEKAERAALKEKEKLEKSAMKEQEKSEKSAMKEKEKAEMTAMKEKERAEREAAREREERERAKQKEKEKYEKMTQKEREKAEKQEQKEKEKFEKMSQKEREKAMREAEKASARAEREAEKEREREEKERLKAEKQLEKAEKKSKKEREPSPTPSKKAATVTISETKRDKEKVLVVEKGPTTRTESHDRPNIEVVTQSQFALLEAAVRELRDVAIPKPLSMPDNAKLRSDLAKGSASLTDTMQAMQVNARVKAAEDAIGRMTDLLTKLAASGAMPDDLASKVDDVKIEPVQSVEMKSVDLAKSRPSISARKSVAIEAKSQVSMGRPSTITTPRPSAMAQSRMSSAGKQSIISMMPGVTQDEMHEALNELKEDLMKNLNNMTTRAVNAADSALYMAKAVSEKLDVALKLDTRISTLYSLVGDYAEQLSGFDSGLTTQMQSFQEQMMQMRGDLKSGLVQLENVNNNAETAAVMELTERYQDLVTELDTTLLAHTALSAFQTDLGNELHTLVETVEMLREQKCDRDEVLDGLRDKADSSRLAGLLTEVEFAGARADLERRLDVCHDKFNRQDGVWMGAVKDLSKITDNKAEIVDLLSARDEAQTALRDLHEKLKILAAVLGEPQAALMTRALAVGGVCGACQVPAHMQPRDAAAGAPARLPALRPPPEPPTQMPCIRDWLPADSDDRHTCHRWCGGSHTLVTESAVRERAPGVVLQATPTKRYTGYGSDGRLYMLEEELQPCLECNALSAEATAKLDDVDTIPVLDGGGDQEPRRATLNLE